MSFKFDPARLERLNDPRRLEMIPPGYVWEKLQLSPCRVIADIGARTGLFSRAFHKLMDGGTVYAADVSEIMIDWMNEHFNVDSEGVLPLKMGESKIPLDDGTVDLVLMFNLFHELDDPRASLDEANRILRKRGKICIADWKKEETLQGPPVHHRIGTEEIAARLREAGFAAVQSDGSLKEHSLLWAEK